MSKQYRILIVEDEKIIAKDLEIRLINMGYEVIGSVTNGKEAFELAISLKPDLILMDIMIMGDQDGIETTRQIKQFQDTPVIYLTAYADEKTFQRAKLSDPFGYLLKPFQERELDLTIRTVLQKFQYEEKIKQSEIRYRSLFEQTQDAIIILDNEGRMLEANLAACEIYSLKTDSIKNYSIFDLVQPKEKDALKQNWGLFLKAGEFKGRYKFIDKFLQIKYIDYQAQANFLEGLHLVVIRDVTAKVENERERENLAKFPSEAPHPILRVNMAGEIIYANKAAEVFQNEWNAKYPNKIPDNLKAKVQAMNILDSQFSISLNVKNRYFLLLFVHVPNGGYVNIYGTDITAQKQSERIINHQKDIMELIAKGENLPTVLERICTKLYQFMPESYPAIHVYDELSKVLRFVSGPRLPFDFAAAMQSIAPGKNNTTIGNVAITKQAVTTFDIQNDPVWSNKISEIVHTSIKSSWAVPVCDGNDNLLAVISLNYKESHKPDPSEIGLVNMACKLACIAIERDQSYQNLFKHSLTFENISDAIILTDMQGRITEWSPSAEKLFGYKRTDVALKKLIELNIFTDQSQIESNMIDALSKSNDEEPKFSMEVEFKNKIGEEGMAELHVVKLNDNRSETQLGYLRVIRDITQRKFVESKLRTSERYLKTIFDNTIQSFVLLDKESNVLTFNKTAFNLTQTITGKKIEPLEPLSDFWYANDTQKFWSVFERALGGEYIQYEEYIPLEFSSPLWLEINFVPVYGIENTLKNICFTALDITDRKAAELEIIASEARFRSLVQNSSDVITVLDEHGKISYTSESVKGMLGYERHLLEGKKFETIVFPEEQELYTDFFQSVLNTNGDENFSIEYRIKNADGQYLYIESVWNNLLKNKNIKGIVINSRDITRRKEAEMELKKTNFELDSFVYRASHDLRAPLRSVLGLLNLVKADQNNQDKYIGLAEKSINKLDTFILDLTNFSRNTRMKIQKEKVDFESIIQECIANHQYMENANRIHVEWQIDIKDDFYSDLSRMNILFSNLISNAIKYQRLGADLNSFVRITINQKNDGVEIYVVDNGKGIAQEYQARIFEMFFRASEDSYGSGLGLYITKQVVEKLNGTISFESEYGKGTAFKVFIPNMPIEEEIQVEENVQEF